MMINAGSHRLSSASFLTGAISKLEFLFSSSAGGQKERNNNLELFNAARGKLGKAKESAHQCRCQ